MKIQPGFIHPRGNRRIPWNRRKSFKEPDLEIIPMDGFEPSAWKPRLKRNAGWNPQANLIIY